MKAIERGTVVNEWTNENKNSELLEQVWIYKGNNGSKIDENIEETKTPNQRKYKERGER